MPEPTVDVMQTLRQKVCGDSALQARLFALREPREFWLALREAALELGLDLDEDTLWMALQEGGRGWHGRLLR